MTSVLMYWFIVALLLNIMTYRSAASRFTGQYVPRFRPQIGVPVLALSAKQSFSVIVMRLPEIEFLISDVILHMDIRKVRHEDRTVGCSDKPHMVVGHSVHFENFAVEKKSNRINASCINLPNHPAMPFLHRAFLIPLAHDVTHR